MCATMLLEADGNPSRKVRVVAQSHQSTTYRVQSILNLCGKCGLNLRSDRNVLSDQSHAELGVESESKIMMRDRRG